MRAKARPAHRLAVPALTVLALVAGLSACSADYRANGTRVRVVASTNVYGSVVRAIAGNRVVLTTFIASAAQDPHSFEADARDELAIAKADLVVENGAGYDEFVDRLRAAVPSSATDPVVLNAAEVSGRHIGPDFNEHLWYDFGVVVALARRLDARLASLQPADRSVFAANTARFIAAVHRLQHRERALRARFAGEGVAITEPVPLYLLHACGLVNRTPRAFSEAVENDTGVSTAVLSRTLALFAGHRVRALVYNAQTTGPETERVVAAAHAAAIPVVPVTETLPPRLDYVTWMRANLDRLATALDPT